METQSVCGAVLDSYRSNILVRSHQYHIAQRHHDALVLKHAYGRWKAAQARIKVSSITVCLGFVLTHLQVQENRAIKHLTRRDDLLVRAIMRIWKAHERGRLLTRVRALRLLRQVWSLWERRMEEQKEREGQLAACLHLARFAQCLQNLHSCSTRGRHRSLQQPR